MDMHSKDLDQTYNYVVGALDAIIREKMDLKSTTADFQNLSKNILNYVNRTIWTDKIMAYYATEMKKVLQKLGIEIMEEYKNIEKAKRLAMEEVRDEQREEAT